MEDRKIQRLKDRITNIFRPRFSKSFIFNYNCNSKRRIINGMSNQNNNKECIPKIKQRRLRAMTLYIRTNKKILLLLQYWKNEQFDSTKNYIRSGFRISHILRGGSGSFICGYTWKCIKMQNVKTGNYQQCFW